MPHTSTSQCTRIRGIEIISTRSPNQQRPDYPPTTLSPASNTAGSETMVTSSTRVPRTTTRLQLSLTMSRVTCLLVALLLLASAGLTPAQGFPRNRRHFFTSCWGWGASCSLYGRGGSMGGGTASPTTNRNAVRVPNRQNQTRRTRPIDLTGVRNSNNMPSPFSSSNWGAGGLGKRDKEVSNADVTRIQGRRHKDVVRQRLNWGFLNKLSHAPTKQN